MRKITGVGIFMAVTLGTIFFAPGINGVVKQHYMITRFQPVEATILSSRVNHTRSHVPRGSTEDFYRPSIEYTYVVNGQTYTSNQVVIFKTHTGYNWAVAIVEAYPKGKKVTAFYNPNDPSESFLSNKYLFLEGYGMIIFSVPWWITALLMWRYFFGYSFRKLSLKKLPASDWYEVPAYLRTTDKLGLALLALIGATVIVVPTLGHYFLVAEPPYDTEAVYFAYACGALGLIPVGYVIYYLLVLRFVGEPKIFTDADQFFLGDEITFRFQQKVSSPQIAEHISLEFLCEKNVVLERKKKKWNQKKWYEEVETLHREEFRVLDRLGGIPSQEIDTVRKCKIPTDGPSSSDQQGRIHIDIPRYFWFFSVKVPVARWITYKVRFPIQVR